MSFKNKTITIAISATLLGGCFLDDDNSIVAAPDEADVLLITDDNRLIGFNRTAPATILKNAALTGFVDANTEEVVGMDLRPRNSTVYVLTKQDMTNTGRLYTLNEDTNTLTLVGTNLGVALSGASFGVDFNAQVDGLRVISDQGQNLVVNPTAGTATAFTALSGSSVDGDAAAYTNSFDGTLNVRMFNIDAARNKLVRQGTAARAFNAGVTEDVASLVTLPMGATIESDVAFDIDGFNNLGYAIMTIGGTTKFYEIDIPFDADGTEAAVLPIPENPMSLNPLAAVELGTLNLSDVVVGMTLLPRGADLAPVVVGLNGDPAGMGTQSLASVPARTPNVAPEVADITGLEAGERVLSIDFRPFDRKIYALTSEANIYTIDRETGEATLVVAIANPVGQAIRDGVAAMAPNTKAYSIDFNTTVAASATFDALRIIGATETGAATNNYRIPGVRLDADNAMAGVAATDPDVRFAPAEVPAVDFGLYGIAYANSVTRPARPAGAPARVIPAPRLIVSDATSNRLLELFNLPVNADPMMGEVVTAGNYSGLKNLRTPLSNVSNGATPPVGVDQAAFNDLSGLDIFGGDNGLRYLVARSMNSGPYSVFNVNITQGSVAPVLTTVGQFGTGTTDTAALFDITIAN
ncbi:DUF4394 domain-containing protein [Limnobacter parvus]|uniref:DUF4394 domain-containing protein n=1 Tax=Limnobacter parvus TaxID=2939690 RepID=A0ABT1XL00_9BURK|nr:DUF4394 domain-containing protein [Limnobacter parvus]MCR2747198.1 DUF4394 domain-containing protein [Limnobacter parvus]